MPSFEIPAYIFFSMNLESISQAFRKENTETSGNINLASILKESTFCYIYHQIAHLKTMGRKFRDSN